MVKRSEDLLAPKPLNIEDFEYLCFDFARVYMTFNEPIPDYATRDHGLLASSLASPQQTFDGKLLYPTLVKQSAILFYSLIKNHPFRNGNKRIAVMALLAFLSINNKWISINPNSLYELACNVSESKPNEKDKTILSIEELLENSIENFNK